MNAPANTRLDMLVIKNKIVMLDDWAIIADIHIDKFMIGIAANAGFVKFNIEAIIDKVMKIAINGPRYEPASLTVLARDEIRTPKLINKRSVVTKMINKSIIWPGLIGNDAPPNKPGSDMIKPKNEAAPERMATIDKAETLPITNSLLFIGVNNKLARVPLSFSPDIDSGQIEITVE